MQEEGVRSQCYFSTKSVASGLGGGPQIGSSGIDVILRLQLPITNTEVFLEIISNHKLKSVGWSKSVLKQNKVKRSKSNTKRA